MKTVFGIINGQKHYEENMTNFVASTVSADSVALLDAKTSAGTMMTKYSFPCIYGTSTAWAKGIW